MQLTTLFALVGSFAAGVVAAPAPVPSSTPQGHNSALPWTTNPPARLGYLCDGNDNKECTEIWGMQGTCYTATQGWQNIVSGYTEPQTHCNIYQLPNCKGALTQMAPGEHKLDFGVLDHTVQSYFCWRGDKASYAIPGM